MAILCCRVCKSTPIIFISASFVPSNLWLEHHHLTRRVVRPTSLCHQTGRSPIFPTQSHSNEVLTSTIDKRYSDQYPSSCRPQNPTPPQTLHPPATPSPPLPRRNSAPHSCIISLPHQFTLLLCLKIAPLYFQHLTHSSQLTIPPIPFLLLTLRTLCQKHPGVVLVSLTKFSPIAVPPKIIP